MGFLSGSTVEMVGDADEDDEFGRAEEVMPVKGKEDVAALREADGTPLDPLLSLLEGE